MSSNSTKREIRKFGLIALLFFGGLCTVAIWRQKVGLTGFFGLLSFMGICFLTLPGPFRPVYRGWLKVAHLIGTLFTMLILTLAYFLVVTPSAWIKKVFGGAPLPSKPDPNRASYWVTRKEPGQPKPRYYLRY